MQLSMSKHIGEKFGKRIFSILSSKDVDPIIYDLAPFLFGC